MKALLVVQSEVVSIVGLGFFAAWQVDRLVRAARAIRLQRRRP